MIYAVLLELDIYKVNSCNMTQHINWVVFRSWQRRDHHSLFSHQTGIHAQCSIPQKANPDY